MTDTPADKLELNRLILAALDGSIGNEAFAELERRIGEEEGTAEYYAEFMAVYIGLRQPGQVCTSFIHPESRLTDGVVSSLWEALAENEKTAVGIDVERPVFPDEETISFVDKRKVVKRRRRVSRVALYTAISSVAALFMMIVYVFFIAPRAPIVASVIDTVEAKWADTEVAIETGDLVRVGPKNLVAGFVQIEFEKGAEIIVQAPAEIEFESTGSVFLKRGKLSSVVPPGAVGFVVRTPSATVVDYGTEFGVCVNEFGDTQAVVFTGEVELRTGSDPVLFKKSRRLGAGQEGMVDVEGNLNDNAIPVSRFIRHMNEIRRGKTLVGCNLIVNGDFESDKIGFDPLASDNDNLRNNIDISGWQDKCAATVVAYKVIGGLEFGQQRQTVRMPSLKGQYLFAGVETCTIKQTVELDGLGYLIDDGEISYELSGWFGGWQDHPDTAELVVRFLDAEGFEAGSAKVGSISVNERHSRTGFVQRSVTGVVPAGTQLVQIELNSYEAIGLADSYADNLKLILSLN